MKFLGKNLYNLAARLAHCAIEGEKKTEEKYFKHFFKARCFSFSEINLVRDQKDISQKYAVSPNLKFIGTSRDFLKVKLSKKQM